MPLPLIPLLVGAGAVAILGAGAAEKSSGGASTNVPGGNVAPTQQSTGGVNGGAQAPSHSDDNAEPANAGGTGYTLPDESLSVSGQSLASVQSSADASSASVSDTSTSGGGATESGSLWSAAGLPAGGGAGSMASTAPDTGGSSSGSGLSAQQELSTGALGATMSVFTGGGRATSRFLGSTFAAIADATGTVY